MFTDKIKSYFWSYSPIHVLHCDNIYYIFGQVHHVNVRRCQLFGHVHRFRSYSFGQVWNHIILIVSDFNWKCTDKSNSIQFNYSFKMVIRLVIRFFKSNLIVSDKIWLEFPWSQLGFTWSPWFRWRLIAAACRIHRSDFWNKLRIQ